MRDLVIIGAGPGGYETALYAKKMGLDVVLIEENKVGGTCLNEGCIPTKTYYAVAKAINDTKKFKEIDFSLNFDMEKALERKNKVVSDLTLGIEFLLKKENILLIHGQASLKSPNQVLVNDEVIETKYIIIATGSKEKRIEKFTRENVLTSKEILDINQIPQNLVIIGGGVIGVEMASIFNSFGSNVTLIEAEKSILSNLDIEISRRMTSYLKSSGIKVLTSTKVQDITSEFVITDEKIPYDKVLLSVGRTPNYIKSDFEIDYHVNEYFKTSIDNIYAIGDVNSKMMLAHFATYSGYKAINHILNIKDDIRLDLTPYAVFAFPEIAHVGLKENEIDGKAYKKMYRANGKANAMGSTEGFIKIIVKDDRIVGASIIGEEANLLISEIAVFIKNETKIKDIKEYIHIHPTLSEIFSELIKEI